MSSIILYFVIPTAFLCLLAPLLSDKAWVERWGMFGFVVFGIVALLLYADPSKPLWGLTSPAIWSMGLALLVLLIDAQSFTNEKKRRLLKVVVASLIVIAGLAAQHQQDQFNDARLQFENQVSQKNDEILAKSEKINGLTREIAFMATGGGSYHLENK